MEDSTFYHICKHYEIKLNSPYQKIRNPLLGTNYCDHNTLKSVNLKISSIIIFGRKKRYLINKIPQNRENFNIAT